MCTHSRSTGDETGFDPTTGTFHAAFDAEPGSDVDSAVAAIVKTVATVTNRDATELDPLYWTVDAEALTALVASSRTDPLEVTFSYEGCQVTVSSHGRVVVASPE